MTKTLLLELLTEELPPKNLMKLGKSFANNIFCGLRFRNFLNDNAIVKYYTTPRRLAVTITNVQAISKDKLIRIKILPVNIAFDATGHPTEILIKKLATLATQLKITTDILQVNKLEKSLENNVANLFYTHITKKDTLNNGLQIILEEAIVKLSVFTFMSYQRQDNYCANDKIHYFIRPAHRLLALYGNTVIPLHILGLQANKITEGHRFLSQGVIIIQNAEDYNNILSNMGKVIPNFTERKEKIRSDLLCQAGSDKILMPEKLLDEITALVEWPAIYSCQFDNQFLTVPQECLILTMQIKQKCFVLTDNNGKLHSRFLVVSNLETSNPQYIIQGNECVVQARLSDAKFFFEQDKKKALIEYLPRLENIIYHNKLGNQLQRTKRIQILAGKITKLLDGNDTKLYLAERSALLSKTDLLTYIVIEFPELQGIMGGYYARHNGEPEAVALAISEHYQPRFSGDILPKSDIGITIALADKLEILVGMWSIGQQPINDKDPFALRRHALGILRILIEKKLPLSITTLIKQTVMLFTNKNVFKDLNYDICTFLYNRLRGLLSEYGYEKNHIESVLSQQPDMLHNIICRLDAIKNFVILPEAIKLIIANKRISNIFKKIDIQNRSPVNNNLLYIDAEKSLYSVMQTLKSQITIAKNKSDFYKILKLLTQLQCHIDCFFNSVMVNVQETKISDNRQNLLYELHKMLNQVADISKLNK